MSKSEPSAFIEHHRRAVEELYQSSKAARWSLTFEDFAGALARAIQKSVETGVSGASELLASIRGEDFALALGCLAGNSAAWDYFSATFRSSLYASAYAITGNDAKGRELADSLYAELYGLDASAPHRASRLAYFHGRSSLKTWLRAVLYQKFVDEHRRESRLEPLPDGESRPENSLDRPAALQSVSEADDRRYAACLGGAVEAVLAALAPEEKLVLGYYYVQGMTLKQIARLSGESEATLSRRLDGLRKKLRKRIEGHLRRVEKLSAFEVDRCLDFASRGALVNLDRVLKPD